MTNRPNSPIPLGPWVLSSALCQCKNVQTDRKTLQDCMRADLNQTEDMHRSKISTDGENALGNGSVVVRFIQLEAKVKTRGSIHEVRQRSKKEAGESNAGKSPRPDRKSTGEIQTSFPAVGTGWLTFTVNSK